MTTPQEQKISDDISTITGGVAQAVQIIDKVNLWSAILGFFTALPGLVSLLQNFMTFVNRASGNNPQAFISKISQAIGQLNDAKTDQEHVDASKAISNVLSGLK